MAMFSLNKLTLFAAVAAWGAGAVLADAPAELPDWAFGPFVRPAGVNPVISPNPTSVFDCPMRKRPLKWEESDTFNPAATVKDGKIVVLYRAEDNTFKGIGTRTSRLGYAETDDGSTFSRAPAPVLYPCEDGFKDLDWEGGCEDPRLAMTEDGLYVLTYTSWNKKVPRLSIATSRDLRHWTKHGLAFGKADGGKYANRASKSAAIVQAPSAKDPTRHVITKVNGKYLMYWGEACAEVATSDNLIDWQPRGVAMTPREWHFDSALTEVGPAALLTEKGILVFYNGKNRSDEKADPDYPYGIYCAGQALFDRNDPKKLLARLDRPYFHPEADFEKTGQYKDGTVFTEGLVFFKGKWHLYYGCADSFVGYATWDPSKAKEKAKEKEKAAYDGALLPLACQEFGQARANASITGRSLSIGGRAFASGLGAHAAGLIPFDVPRTDKAAFVRFSGWVGIDDDVEKDDGDGAVFVVSSGCAELWRSPVMRHRDAARRFEVILPPGVTRVYLQMLAGANDWCDHCDWCDLQFVQVEADGDRSWPTRLRLEPPAGRADAGPALRDALARLQASGRGSELEFAKGTYHFYVDSAPRLSFHVSNNDHPAVHPVAIPLVGLRQVKVKGNGSKFILHGAMMAALVMDSAGVELAGVDIEYAESQIFNATVVGFDGGRTVVKPDTRRCPYEIDGNGLIVYRGHGGMRLQMQAAMAFDGRTGEIIERTSDLGLARVVGRNPDGTVSLDRDYSKVGAGMKAGDVIVMRNHARGNPSVVIYRAKDTLLEDVVVRNSFGMALVGQRSENITLRGTRKAADRTAGMFAPAGVFGSISADATHFSNCRGLVAVENCWFEGMMDDAINVHSTCLRIQEKLAPNRLLCRYMHGQSIGFETFLPGETLRFIKGPVLENGAEAKVAAVKKLSARDVEITLAEDVPEEYGAGDAVENADYQPEVRFAGNYVAHNRARGCLFTTPRRVRVTDNVFDTVSGAAILFAGDAQGWYESGACRDVLVEGNVFRNNLTSRFQFTEGIISVYPEIRCPAQQKQAYHANITIRKNRFETFDVPLLYARSVDGLHFDDNEVVYNAAYRGWAKPRFNVERTRNFTAEGNRYGAVAK